MGGVKHQLFGECISESGNGDTVVGCPLGMQVMV